MYFDWTLHQLDYTIQISDFRLSLLCALYWIRSIKSFISAQISLEFVSIHAKSSEEIS